MDKGWVKLHRQISENHFLMKDNNAYMVFTKLLMIVGKRKGEWAGGRNQLAEYMNMNPRTLYGVLIRLEERGLLNISANNKYSVISICKWHVYQSDTQQVTQLQLNNNATTTQHSNKKKKENKKINKKDFVILLPDLESELQAFIEHRKATRKVLTPYGFELMQKKLQKLYQDTETQRICLNHAIERGWSTVFPLKADELHQSVEEDKVTAMLRRYNAENA